MNLTFLGAAHQVTGSCFLLETQGKRVLIDCGMEQGPDIFDRQELNIYAPTVDFVLLTHAHIDHSGMLPLLDKQGFCGEVLTTEATAKLCNIMLKDSAFIQMQEAEWKNRKAQRNGEPIVEPIYTLQDAENVLSKFRTTKYNELVKLTDNISVRFNDAGHLLGSAIIEVFVQESDIQRKMVFSGDLGNSGHPLLNDPKFIDEADYVVVESTYGDRIHSTEKSSIEDLAAIINSTFLKGGKIIIPSFAVGRTQELLYYLRQIKELGLVTALPNFKIYLDSPLAIEATNIFKNIDRDYLDKEANELLDKGINPIGVPDLYLSVTSDDSKLINEKKDPCMIISASGMCEAGRIRHHLKHNLWNPNNTVLFVGYQVVGTLGFNILSGAKKVKLFQEEINVGADIRKLKNTSAHADKWQLAQWLRNFKDIKKVFVVHGDVRVTDMFADYINDQLGISAVAPQFGECYDLTVCGEKIHGAIPRKRLVKKKTKRNRSVSYQRLLNAFETLHNLISGCDGWSNRDLDKMAGQIEEFNKKWK